MQAGTALGNLVSAIGMHAEEAALLADLKAGSEDAFGILIAQYHQPLYSLIARSLNDPSDAADTTQEVFIKAYENFSHLRSSPTAGGWLKTVTTNLTINHLTRYRRRWRFFSELKTDEDGENSPGTDPQIPVPDTLLTDLSDEQRRAAIDDALRRLPDHQRLPLVLYHFENLSYEEIAARLHHSLAKIKTDIRRARAALLPLLQAKDVRP